jgi:hypothetical protein
MKEIRQEEHHSFTLHIMFIGLSQNQLFYRLPWREIYYISYTVIHK